MKVNSCHDPVIVEEELACARHDDAPPRGASVDENGNNHLVRKNSIGAEARDAPRVPVARILPVAIRRMPLLHQRAGLSHQECH